jgi:hypothetical protein
LQVLRLQNNNHCSQTIQRGGIDRGGIDRGGIDRGGIDRGGIGRGGIEVLRVRGCGCELEVSTDCGAQEVQVVRGRFEGSGYGVVVIESSELAEVLLLKELLNFKTPMK